MRIDPHVFSQDIRLQSEAFSSPPEVYYLEGERRPGRYQRYPISIPIVKLPFDTLSQEALLGNMTRTMEIWRFLPIAALREIIVGSRFNTAVFPIGKDNKLFN